MYKNSLIYPIVSRVAAVVLLVAGGLKAQEALSTTVFDPTPWEVALPVAFELLFGMWLLTGLAPRWTRIAALGCFVILLNIALAGALQQRESCGCFGKVPVRPWAAVALDGLMVVALLLSAPTSQPSFLQRAKNRRLAAFGMAVLVMLGLFGWHMTPLRNLGRPSISSSVNTEMTPGVEVSVLERVIQGLERNHSALHTLVCSSEITLTTYPIQSKLNPPAPSKTGDSVVQRPTEQTRRLVVKSIIRGDELRRDCDTNLPGFDAREILVGSKGKRVQYAPNLHQAWISDTSDPSEGRGESIDLRCAGFSPPVRSIADWLRKAKIVSSAITRDGAGNEIVRLRVLARLGGGEDDVTADFVSSMNYMPSRVVHNYYPNGGVFTVYDLEYQKIDAAKAWIPKTIKDRSFVRDTTSDPDAATGFNIRTHTEVRLLSFGSGVRDEHFDPILPPNTRLVGPLAAQPWTGKAPVRASSVTREDPVRVVPQAPQHVLGALSWFWAVAMTDLVVVGVCMAFRRRLAW